MAWGVYTLVHPNVVHRCASLGHITPTVASGGVCPKGTLFTSWPMWVVGAFLPVLVVVLWSSHLVGMAGMFTLWPM